MRAYQFQLTDFGTRPAGSFWRGLVLGILVTLLALAVGLTIGHAQTYTLEPSIPLPPSHPLTQPGEMLEPGSHLNPYRVTEGGFDTGVRMERAIPDYYGGAPLPHRDLVNPLTSDGWGDGGDW